MNNHQPESQDSTSTRLMKSGFAFGGLGCMIMVLAPIIAVIVVALIYPFKEVIGSPIGWIFALLVLFFVILYVRSERLRKKAPRLPESKESL